MMWIIARRRCSPARTCASSSLTRCCRARNGSSPRSLNSSSTRCSLVVSCAPAMLGVVNLPLLQTQGLDLLFQRYHLELAADNHFLKFLEVANLLLQLRFRLLKVPDRFLVRPHIAQNAEGADN